MITFQTCLKNSRKPTQAKESGLTSSKSDECFPGNYRFASLATLVDEDADIDSMVTHSNKAVTDTAPESLGKQRRKMKPWITPILDLCGQRRDLKKKRGEPEGDKTIEKLEERSGQRWRWQKRRGYRVNARKWQEVEACLRKNNIKQAHKLVKDLTTEKKGKSTTVQVS